MSSVAAIKEYISKLPKGEPFSSRSLRGFASTENVRQILNRLVKFGEINRLGRGVFVKPESYNKQTLLPSVLKAIKTLTEATGEVIALHGAETARQLELTTQVPARLTFYTNANSRTIKLANRTIRLKHVNPSRLIAPMTMAGNVISALLYLGQEAVTLEMISFIEKKISPNDFKKIIELREKMPGWLSDAFYKYQQEVHHGK